MPLLLTLSDLAGELALTPDQFRERRGALRRLGFPEPVPGLGSRWDPEAVRAWLACQRASAKVQAVANDCEIPAADLAPLQAELDRRAIGFAQRRRPHG